MYLHLQVLAHTSELLRDSQERVHGSETTLEQTQRRLSKMDTAFKTASQEVMKVRLCSLPTLLLYSIDCCSSLNSHQIILHSTYVRVWLNTCVLSCIYPPQGNEIIQKFQNEIRSLKSKVYDI